jgi:hypothetical protein
MANTMTLISATTLSSAASSIVFSSIPSTYTDLCVKMSLRSSDASAFVNFTMRFNGTSGGTAYSTMLLYGSGSAAVTAANASAAQIDYGFQDGAGATANTFANIEFYMPNYANTSYNKSLSLDQSQENNTTAAYGGFIAGLYASTSAINQIGIYSTAGNFVTNSTAYLYGIKSS